MASFEDFRTQISALYATSTLPMVKKKMEEAHSFTKTEKQWKTQIKKWHLDKKNLKNSDYQAIVRKKRKRQVESGKETLFKLQGRDVPPEKIQRWEERNLKGDFDYRTLDAETPKDLVYSTPKSPYGTTEEIEILVVPPTPGQVSIHLPPNISLLKRHQPRNIPQGPRIGDHPVILGFTI